VDRGSGPQICKDRFQIIIGQLAVPFPGHRGTERFAIEAEPRPEHFDELTKAALPARNAASRVIPSFITRYARRSRIGQVRFKKVVQGIQGRSQATFFSDCIVHIFRLK
jgi:hypothetical protein